MVIGKLETQSLIEARIVILQIKLIVNNNDLIIMIEWWLLIAINITTCLNDQIRKMPVPNRQGNSNSNSGSDDIFTINSLQIFKIFIVIIKLTINLICDILVSI